MHVLKNLKGQCLLWNGLPARLYLLTEQTPFRRLVRRELIKLGNSKPELGYWLVEASPDGEPIYAVVGDVQFVDEKVMTTFVMPKPAEFIDRILFVIYKGKAYFWSSNTAKTLLSAIDRKISPNMAALISPNCINEERLL